MCAYRTDVFLSHCISNSGRLREFLSNLLSCHFIAVEGFNPRIHALYFCPQLFRYDDGDRLVPLEGEEIGQLIARAVEAGAAERRPWYEPTDKLPQEPLIKSAMLGEFDTLVVELPLKRESLPAAGQQLLSRPRG